METKKVTVYMVMAIDNRRYGDVCVFDVPETLDKPSYKKAALKIDWLVNKLFATIKKKVFVDNPPVAPDQLKNSIQAIEESIQALIDANRKIYGTDDDESYLKLIPLTGFQIPKWGKDNPR